ncbi:olfactory receptor 1361-like [Rhinolophus ferrumequinum]|uniref:olfactory receptor 1361-like n=1 Tax=Rhinolophus ferrumequinum TaxID=59479 RepID=UPI00140FB5E7|nr:olfactory receptor 1361-like [Rhinolophus ferrumequinum]
MDNWTRVSEFILLGLSEQPQQQELLFGLSCSLYLIGCLGNVLTLLAIVSDPHLHSPMYFFLCNLSLLDICFTSTTIPKMLLNHLSGHTTISSSACLAQMYFFIAFGAADSILLSAMAYDRYLAICCPLQYMTIMSVLRCASLVVVPWVLSNLISMVHTILMTHLSFCTNRIPHFFCDLNALIKLSCSDTQVNKMLVCPQSGGSGKHSLPVSLTFASSSLYGTIIGVYFNPTSTHTTQRDMAATVMYTMVAPVLNPFIYSLRNRDLKSALRKLLSENHFVKPL